MRTIIDLPDALPDHAKTIAAAAADSTVRELVIEGLQAVVARRETLAQLKAWLALPTCRLLGIYSF